MSKKIIYLALLPLLLTGCNKQTYDDSFEHFCHYYDNYHISYYIENTTEHDVHEIRTTKKTLMAQSEFSIEGHYFLYAKLDVLYVSNDNFYNLNWLVEYEYSKDYSYENAVCYSNTEVTK